VSDFALPHRPDLGGFKCHHGGSFSRQRRKLYFVRLPISVEVNHCPDVAWLKAFTGYWHIQDHAIMFFDHNFPS
jgi:hypothetical protein